MLLFAKAWYFTHWFLVPSIIKYSVNYSQCSPQGIWSVSQQTRHGHLRMLPGVAGRLSYGYRESKHPFALNVLQHRTIKIVHCTWICICGDQFEQPGQVVRTHSTVRIWQGHVQFCTVHVYTYMYMYHIHVHVSHTCTCITYMYMYHIHVHVSHTCTCITYMYMYHIHVLSLYILTGQYE